MNDWDGGGGGRRTARRLVVRWALAAGLLALLPGCAHVYVGDDGSRHVIGLVWLTLPPVSARPPAAEAIRTRSLGLTLTLSEVGNALTLGYSDATLAFVRNDSVVPAAALLLDTEWNTAWVASPPERGARQ